MKISEGRVEEKKEDRLLSEHAEAKTTGLREITREHTILIRRTRVTVD